jgi:PEGA domain
MGWTTTRSLVFALVALCWVVFTRPVMAAPETSQDLDALYQAAKVDLAAKRYAFALEKLHKGLALPAAKGERAWGFLIGAALAYDGLGKPEAALTYYHRLFRALDEAQATRGLSETWQNRRKGIKARADKLEARVLKGHAALVLASSPAGASISVDGVPFGFEGQARTPETLYLPPGKHLLRLTKDGRKPAELAFNSIAGQSKDVHVPMYRADKKAIVFIRTGGSKADVLIDGRRVGRGLEVEVSLEAGGHMLQVNRVGYAPYMKEVQVEAGKRGVVLVEWDEDRAAVIAAAPTRKVIPKVEQVKAPETTRMPVMKRRASKGLDPLWGWVIGGSGLALITAGVPFTLMAKGKHDDLSALRYEPVTPENETSYADTESAMERNQVIAGVCYGVGAAAIAGGAAWLIWGSLNTPGATTKTSKNSARVPWLGAVPLDDGGLVTFRWSL